MKTIILLTLFYWCTFSADSQTFEKTYFQGDGRCILQKEDSSFIIAPWKNYLMHISSVGDSTSVDEYSNTALFNIIRLHDGGYITSGTYIPNDGCVIRLDNSMDTLWMKTFPQNGNPSFVSEITELADSSIAFSIGGEDLNGGHEFFAKIIHLDQNGNLTWQTDTFIPELLICNIASKDTQLYSAANINYNGHTSVQLTCQNAMNGDTIWQKLYIDSFTTLDNFCSLSLLATDSNLYMAGFSVSNSTGTSVFQQMIIKTDLNGDSVWMHKYSMGSTTKIISTSPNTLTCVGSQDNDSIVLFQIDSSGNTLWTKYFSPFDQSTAYDLISTSDGGFAFSGNTIDSVNNIYYLYAVRTDSLGKVLSTIGISEINEKPVNYYYDAINHFLKIDMEEKENLMALIYSLDGKLIFRKSINDKTIIIDTNSLITGQYIVALQKSNVIVSRYKFITF
jgi:hypothetical protein